jgi:hypothetical protein
MEKLMFYPVKILNPKGNVVKIISRKELSQRHWREVFSHPKNDGEHKPNKDVSRRKKAG